VEVRTVTDDLGRWADPSLLVLASLADGPKHGYAITQDVAAQVGVQLGPGTLYGAIGRLEERGLIEALPPEQRRRPYRITAAGAQELAHAAARMRRVADLGLTRLAAARATA
jgi:DNA-binding PadR family transcriptional regulator